MKYSSPCFFIGSCLSPSLGFERECEHKASLGEMDPLDLREIRKMMGFKGRDKR